MLDVLIMNCRVTTYLLCLQVSDLSVFLLILEAKY